MRLYELLLKIEELKGLEEMLAKINYDPTGEQTDFLQHQITRIENIEIVTEE